MPRAFHFEPIYIVPILNDRTESAPLKYIKRNLTINDFSSDDSQRNEVYGCGYHNNIVGKRSIDDFFFFSKITLSSGGNNY